jgi:hypothetical protein
LRGIFVRRSLLIPFLLTVAACGANQQAQYERAIECEMLTGIIGAYHPNLSRAQLGRLQQANRSYHERSEALGATLSKSSEEVDGARRTYLEGMQRRLSSGDRNQVAAGFTDAADTCRDELD